MSVRPFLVKIMPRTLKLIITEGLVTVLKRYSLDGVIHDRVDDVDDDEIGCEEEGGGLDDIRRAGRVHYLPPRPSN